MLWCYSFIHSLSTLLLSNISLNSYYKLELKIQKYLNKSAFWIHNVYINVQLYILYRIFFGIQLDFYIFVNFPHLGLNVCVLFSEMFDLKMKYDESDNLMIRATRAFTDKIGYVFGM